MFALHDFVDMSLDKQLAKIDKETAQYIHGGKNIRKTGQSADYDGGARREVKLARITRGRYTSLHEDGPSDAEERLVSCTHDCAYVYLRMKLNTSKSSRDGRLAGSRDGRGDQDGNRGGGWGRSVHLMTVRARDGKDILKLRLDV